MEAVRPYPEELGYFYKSLTNYSQNNSRLTTSTLPQLTPGDLIQVTLPDNNIVNMDSFVIRADLVGFRGSGSNDQAILPKLTSSFIDAVTIDIGGRVIDGSVASGYNQLCKIKTDLWAGNSVAERGIMELSQDFPGNVGSNLAAVGYTASTIGQIGVQIGSSFTVNSDINKVSAANVGSVNAWPILIRFPHTFFGCGKSLDLTTLPPVRLTARLATSSVVMENANATNTNVATYGLYNIKAYVTTVSLNDDQKYYSMVRASIDNGGLPVPFKRYVSKTGASLTASGSVLFPLITDSLDAVYVFLLKNSPGRTAPTATGKVAPQFTRTSFNNSQAIQNVQIDLNGSLWPQWQVEPKETWYLVRESLAKEKHVYGVDPTLTAFTWAESFFVFAYRWAATPGTWYRSGYNTSGLTVPAAALINTTGDMQCTPWVIAECTSVLHIKKDRDFDLYQ